MKALVVSFAVILALKASGAPAAKSAGDARVEKHYQVGKVMMPTGIDPQIGALAVLGNGRIAAAFHHGEVAIYDPQKKSWKTFAEGLHEPLGMIEDTDGSLLVMQRPELTRLRDENGDGVAESYESFWNDFGLTGNYHEFAFGPARGPDGKLYVGLNLASNGASIREEIRGEWSAVGVPRADFLGEWKKVASKVGRMYSRVAWRGWIMEIDPKTGVGTPYASGVRSPDGLGFDAQGQLLVSDNQGDWRGTSELFVVKKDGFYGHPASLVWKKDWDGTEPLKMKVADLEKMRTPAAVWFPHNIYANSPTQPVLIPKTPAWGAFGGQVLIGEMNSPKLLRVLLEEVNGVWQGACVNLINSPLLKGGLHRLAFAGDTLWIGRTHLSWAGGEGMASVTPIALPFDPATIHVTPKGFRLEFTEALAPSSTDPSLWNIQSYSYKYHSVYGSPQMDKTEETPTKVSLSNGGKTAEIELAALRAGFVYDLRLDKLKSAAGATLLNPSLAYTLLQIPK